MVVSNAKSDTDLLQEITAGNMAAFKELFNRYKRKLYYFSFGYLGNRDEAEDVVQQVFVNLWMHRETLNEELSIKNYIYKSAVNTIYNHLKKLAIRNKYVENQLQTAVNHSNITHDEILYNDLRKTIQNIVDELPEQQKKIFVLSRQEGLSYEEIASQLNISIRTVENHVFRALKIIRENLKVELFFLCCIIYL